MGTSASRDALEGAISRSREASWRYVALHRELYRALADGRDVGDLQGPLAEAAARSRQAAREVRSLLDELERPRRPYVTSR